MCSLRYPIPRSPDSNCGRSMAQCRTPRTLTPRSFLVIVARISSARRAMLATRRDPSGEIAADGAEGRSRVLASISTCRPAVQRRSGHAEKRCRLSGSEQLWEIVWQRTDFKIGEVRRHCHRSDPNSRYDLSSFKPTRQTSCPATDGDAGNYRNRLRDFCSCSPPTTLLRSPRAD